MSAQTLVARIFCKGWEYGARALTRLRAPFGGDATKILVEAMTPAQRDAAASSAQTGRIGSGRVLILVPFRDRWELTASCVRSLEQQKLGGGYTIRVCLIDNGSKAAATLTGIVEAKSRARPGLEVTSVALDEEFNYSRINNKAVRANQDFAADWLLFLNNDVELASPGDLQAMIAFAEHQPRLGALGCSLTYPDGRIQHLFAAPGIKIVAAHPLRGRRLEPACAWFAAPRPVAAVTGAALLVAAKAFEQVDGFDEALPSVGQDIDLCLKLQKKGLVNWVLPNVRLVHHETATRHPAIDKSQVALLYQRWGEFLTKNPYFSSALSRFSEQPAFKLPGEPAYPWNRVL